MKPITSRIATALALAFAIAACVPKPRPPAPAPAAPVVKAQPAPPPPPAQQWIDAPQTPGDWRYTSSTTGGRASFANAGPALFTIRCDLASRSVVLTRANAAGAAQMIVRTETQSRTLTGGQDSADLYAMSARVPARDRLLDAMALTKGRFAVEVANSATLYLPSWAEVTRVIEDCR